MNHYNDFMRKNKKNSNNSAGNVRRTSTTKKDDHRDERSSSSGKRVDMGEKLIDTLIQKRILRHCQPKVYPMIKKPIGIHYQPPPSFQDAEDEDRREFTTLFNKEHPSLRRDIIGADSIIEHRRNSTGNLRTNSKGNLRTTSIVDSAPVIIKTTPPKRGKNNIKNERETTTTTMTGSNLYNYNRDTSPGTSSSKNESLNDNSNMTTSKTQETTTTNTETNYSDDDHDEVSSLTTNGDNDDYGSYDYDGIYKTKGNIKSGVKIGRLPHLNGTLTTTKYSTNTSFYKKFDDYDYDDDDDDKTVITQNSTISSISFDRKINNGSSSNNNTQRNNGRINYYRVGLSNNNNNNNNDDGIKINNHHHRFQTMRTLLHSANQSRRYTMY